MQWAKTEPLILLLVAPTDKQASDQREKEGRGEEMEARQKQIHLFNYLRVKCDIRRGTLVICY